jgi:hypothetical protein
MSFSFEINMGCIIGGWMIIIIFLLAYTIINNILNTDSHVFRIGPNPDFFILGISIDTFPKYGIIVSFCFINSGIRSINGNVLHSWIINEVQDIKNKNPMNYKKAYVISFISIIYNWFDFFMYMNILLSQIDMLFVEILSDLIMNFYLTKHYLHLKCTNVDADLT